MDVHEPRTIAEQLQGVGAAVVMHSLAIGDYLTDEIIIERKTVRDLHLEAALASIPSISTGCARSLLKHFGSVAAVAAASPDRLVEVPGIGTYRAARVAETLSAGQPLYRSRRSRERQDPAT